MATNITPFRPKNLIDAQEVRHAWSILTKPGFVYEIRCIKATLCSDRPSWDKPRTINGYFNNVEKLITALQQIASADGVYIIPNPCQSALLAHTNNRFRDRDTKCAKDDEIVARHGILFDIDPNREGGITGIPATEAESKKALEHAKAIYTWLIEHGYPAPIIIDSGNGIYLHLPVDLPADDNGLVQRFLHGAAKELDTEQSHIDLTTYNQARLMRLPGTWNCKGDSCEGREHRIAKVLNVPDQIQNAPLELLEFIAAPVEQEQPKQEQKIASKNTSYKKDKQLPDYLDEWNVTYGSQQSYNNGSKWQLEECPFCHNSDHNAFVYVASNGKFGFKCSHNSCTGRDWQAFRLHFEPGAYDKRDQWTNYSPRQEDSSNGNGKTPYKIQGKDLCDFSPDDAGNGEAMYQLFGRVFAYNEAIGWLYYTGTHWEPDEGQARLTRAAIDTLRKRRHAAVEAEMENIVKATISDTKRINGAITCFRAHVVVSVDIFDAQEHLLNCKNGVVNLKTGRLTPHSNEQRFTYCVPVEYKDSDAAEWIDYLQGVVGGGAEMIDYLQLALGYSLTGSTREECLFYVYGPSRSGKGTVSEVFLRLLPRPLATMVDFNSFTAKREGDVSNFDLAELKPSRVVFASESQRNQSLNPAKIKQLTGGDLVRASFKHKQFFTYRPQFKVWMLSNWPVNGDPEDDALWGRVRVIPFPNSFLGKEDKSKKERLKSDEVLTSILYWGVQGAIKWYALDSSGLQTPAYVTDVTKSQRDAQDFVQQWISECCEEDKEAWTSNETIIANYTQWCEGNNVAPKKAKALAQSLQMKGFTTGVVRRIGARTQKGVSGIKIPVTLWSTEENVTDDSELRMLRQNPAKNQISICEDEFPVSSVTSVTLNQSVTNGFIDSIEDSQSNDFAGGFTPIEKANNDSKNVTDGFIPDDFTYEDNPCSACGCGLTRSLDGSQSCVRCYPPKGYHAYSNLVDKMYPRKQKTEFGKGGLA